MNKKAPAITVLMSVYNAETFLDEAILSIRNQTHQDFEFLIINDGSTDNSAEILNRHSREDSRIRIIHQENRGLIAALNRGIEEARAPYIARMDSDDIALPDRLAKQWQRMLEDEELGLVGGHIHLINSHGETQTVIRFPVGEPEIKERIYYGSPVAHPAAMMRRELIRKVGGYRSFYKHCEDYDLWLRLSEHAKIDNLDEVVLLYRRHGSSISMTNRENQTTGTFLAQAAWLLRHKGLPDPTDEWAAIDRRLLHEIPLPPEEKWRLLCRWTLATVESLPNESFEEGANLLKTLQSTPGRLRGDSSLDLFRINGKLARSALKAGYKRQAMLYASHCIRHEPLRSIRETLRRALSLAL